MTWLYKFESLDKIKIDELDDAMRLTKGRTQYLIPKNKFLAIIDYFAQAPNKDSYADDLALEHTETGSLQLSYQNKKLFRFSKATWWHVCYRLQGHRPPKPKNHYVITALSNREGISVARGTNITVGEEQLIVYNKVGEVISRLPLRELQYFLGVRGNPEEGSFRVSYNRPLTKIELYSHGRLCLAASSATFHYFKHKVLALC